MATRDDVKVDFEESPRIIEVAAPSAEMTMQDLVDTLRKIEDAFMKGMSHEKLIDAAGKEDLGGGLFNGITNTLQNAQLSFEPRRTAAAVGTVTTGSGSLIGSPLGPTYSFVDASADFVTAGVQRGSMVINFTDQSIADVVEVVSATELRTRELVNGTDNEWDIGDDYQVFNVEQCEALGGNLVAVDDGDVVISPVFPTAFTQIVRAASSSATLINNVSAQDFVDALLAITIDGGKDFEQVLKELLAMANGRIVESSPGVFDFYEQDNSTVIFTLTKSGNERTRS